MKRMFPRVGILALVAGLFGFLSAQTPNSDLLITEVLYDANGSDTDREWVEIYNRGTAAIDMTGYKITDEESYPGGTEGVFQFPDGFTIQPGQVVIIAQKATGFAGDWGFNPDLEIEDSDPNVPDMIPIQGTNLYMANSGDEVLLIDNNDNVLDAVVYGTGGYGTIVPGPDVPSGHSLERIPPDQDTDDCSTDFTDMTYPAPGNWANLVGDIESELTGGNDWDNGDAATYMNDHGLNGDAAPGDGIYTLHIASTTGSFGWSGAGYQVVRRTGFWPPAVPQYPGQNIPINFNTGDEIYFYFVRAPQGDGFLPDSNFVYDSKMADIVGAPFFVVGDCQTEFGATGDWSATDTTMVMHDNGTNGDSIAGDGIYTYQGIISTGGTYNFKVLLQYNSWQPQYAAEGFVWDWGTPFTFTANDGDLVRFELNPAQGRVRVTILTPPALVYVKINEFIVTPTYAEAIEIYNPEAQDANLDGWHIIITGSSFEDTSTIAGVVVPAGGFAQITDNEAPGLSLPNEGAIIKLYNPDYGVLVDQVGYGSMGGAPAPIYQWSSARVVDGQDTNDDAADFNMDPSPTMGASNDVPGNNLGGSDVVINEVNPGSASPFIELFNRGTSAVDISNWAIVVDDDYYVPNGTVLNPGEFFLLSHTDFPPYFNMGATGDNLYLFDAAGQRVDQMGWWTRDVADSSWAAVPDGDRFVFDGYDIATSTDFQTAGATPGMPNQPPANTAVVVITAQVGGDSHYRSFWANGSWDAQGNYDPNWSGPMVELKNDGVYPDTSANDDIFTGTVLLHVDSTNWYNYWIGSENDVNSWLEDGSGFQVLSSDTVWLPAVFVDPSDQGYNNWIIVLAGDFNGWDVTADNLTRTGTVWSGMFFFNAGDSTGYKYAVMHSWAAAYGQGGIGGAGQNYSFVAPNTGYYIFAFDDADNSVSVTPGPAFHTIMEIQGQDSTSPYQGDTVATTGIVTGVYSNGFFMEEQPGGAWHGIWVYTGGAPGVTRGDSILIVAQVDEYYGMTELKNVVLLQVLASGRPLPGPTVLPTGDVPQEQYEGVFVRVENAVCVDPNLGYGEWLVDDGSGPVRVDDKGYAFTPDSGQAYNVQGPLYYSYGNFKIEPRDSADIEPVSGEVVLFFDDFESGLGNWIGDWGLQEGDTVHSPTHAFTESPYSNYPDMSTLVGMMANGVDLTGYAGAYLRFWNVHWLEQGFDYGYVDVSIDGGNTWVTLATFNDTLDTWTQEEIDLSAFVGNPDVRIRFRVVSDPAYHETGWFVDDVEIVGTTVDQTPPLILHTPPADTQSILGAYVVDAEILDYSPLAYDSLFYSFDGGPFVGIGPDSTSGTHYYFTIPAPTDLGTYVSYFLTAADTANNATVTDTFFYITGYVLYFDDGDPGFITQMGPGDNIAVQFAPTPDSSARILWMMYNFYMDPSHPLDTVDVYVWGNAGGLPGIPLFGPYAVYPANTPMTPHAWTYVDVRSDSIATNDPFYVGAHFRSTYPVILIDSPSQFNHSYFQPNGGSWSPATVDFFIRCIVDYGEVGVAEQDQIPAYFALYPAYPNPARNITNIKFALPKPTKVQLQIYDLTGRVVRTLVDGTLPAGYHTVQWDGRNDQGRRVAQGVYFYRFQAESYRSVKKLLLVR